MSPCTAGVSRRCFALWRFTCAKHLRPEVRSQMSDTRNQKSMQIKSARDLIVYQKAYALAMEIFEITRKFPAEEKYSLVDQIRRSSRWVCTNLREAWAKRKYVAHFVSKLTDADGENG